MKTFLDKTVVITGAAGGIGQTLARKFGAQGAKIAALDINDNVQQFVDELLEEGIEALAVVANISSQ